MFRTHNTRGLERFLALRKTAGKNKTLATFTQKHCAVLERTTVLTLGEKIELLCVATGNKLSTEIFQNIAYIPNNDEIEIPVTSSLQKIHEVLRILPFDFFLDEENKLNRLTKKQQIFTWYQVSANKATSEFFKSYPDDIAEYEEGIIYGYPITAIRAFAGLIEQSRSAPHTPWSYYLGGIFSQDWIQEEDEYYQKIWESLRSVSSSLIAEAEDMFEGKLLNIKD